jgi:hypothetical protein
VIPILAAAAFPFFYIEPAKNDHARITMKFTGKISRKQLEEIAPIGNSPTYMSMADMKKVGGNTCSCLHPLLQEQLQPAHPCCQPVMAHYPLLYLVKSNVKNVCWYVLR